LAVKYIGNNNKQIQYLALSTDEKPTGDVGSILFVYDSGTYFINVDGVVDWQPYVAPKLAT
jgi:hypothetical protein